MFTNSAMDSNLYDALVVHDYEDHYLFASNMAKSGLDHSEYYFMARESYEELEKEVFKLHEQYVQKGDSFKQKLVSCIEDDPVMMSSKKKYLIFLRSEFGHFILNTILNIALVYDAEPEAIFVIAMDPPEKEDSEMAKVVRYIEKFMLDHNINYYFLRSSHYLDTMNMLEVNTRSPLTKSFLNLEDYRAPIAHYLVYKVKNASGIESGLTTRNLTVKDIKFLVDKYINNCSEVVEHPDRRVYITRRVYDSEPYAFSGNGYKSSSIRIYDEQLLENYLISKNFEIVDFTEIQEIQDQINLMRGVSVLIGATGTGLTNQLFMNDGQVVVELRVEHGEATTKHWMPIEYFYLSSGKEHSYIALDIKDKQATTAISKLDKILSAYDLQFLAKDGLKK